MRPRGQGGETPAKDCAFNARHVRPAHGTFRSGADGSGALPGEHRPSPGRRSRRDRYAGPMDTATPPPHDGSAATRLADDVPAVRACTRCDDEQHLVDAASGFGKFRCIGCGMVVGFDLEGAPVEFLIDRGAPGLYTRGLFGSRLQSPEQRLP